MHISSAWQLNEWYSWLFKFRFLSSLLCLNIALSINYLWFLWLFILVNCLLLFLWGFINYIWRVHFLSCKAYSLPIIWHIIQFLSYILYRMYFIFSAVKYEVNDIMIAFLFSKLKISLKCAIYVDICNYLQFHFHITWNQIRYWYFPLVLVLCCVALHSCCIFHTIHTSYCVALLHTCM